MCSAVYSCSKHLIDTNRHADSCKEQDDKESTLDRTMTLYGMIDTSLPEVDITDEWRIVYSCTLSECFYFGYK